MRSQSPSPSGIADTLFGKARQRLLALLLGAPERLDRRAKVYLIGDDHELAYVTETARRILEVGACPE